MPSREETALRELGNKYSVCGIDGGEVVYRKLATHELEVTIRSNAFASIYVWRLTPRVLDGIYHEVPLTHLPDYLGYLAIRYQRLLPLCRVEREDLTE